LRYAFFVTCTDLVKDAEGNITEIHCTYDPETRGGDAPDGRKPKGTIHWVSSRHAVDAEVRLYDRLFDKSNPTEGKSDMLESLNPESLKVLRECKLEPALDETTQGENYQFERLGYFCLDSSDSKPGELVFNRTVPLRDSWAKLARQNNKK